MEIIHTVEIFYGFTNEPLKSFLMNFHSLSYPVCIKPTSDKLYIPKIYVLLFMNLYDGSLLKVCYFIEIEISTFSIIMQYLG